MSAEEHGYTVRGQYRFPHLDDEGCCRCMCPSCEGDDVCICPNCDADKCGRHDGEVLVSDPSKVSETHMHIAFAGDVPPDELEEFFTAVAEVVMGFEPRTAWDPLLTAEIAAGGGLGV